jgi:hypothetical protein
MSELVFVAILTIVLVSQIGGIIYWANFYDDYVSKSDITVGTLIMFVLTPIGLLFDLLIITVAYAIMWLGESLEPILSKQIFKD